MEGIEMRLNRRQLRSMILEALGSDEEIAQKFQAFNDTVVNSIQSELGEYDGGLEIEVDGEKKTLPANTALTYSVKMLFPDEGGYEWENWTASGGDEEEDLTNLVKVKYAEIAESPDYQEFISDVSKEFGSYGPFEITIKPPKITGRTVDMEGDTAVNESKITRKRLRQLILQEMSGFDPSHPSRQQPTVGDRRTVMKPFTMGSLTNPRRDQIDLETGLYPGEEIGDLSWQEHQERMMDIPDPTGEAPEGFYDEMDFYDTLMSDWDSDIDDD
jgi:hypothetical protein